jgi:hypothetical protein
MIDPVIKANNEAFINSMRSNDSSLQKEAMDSASSFLQLRAREDGFTRRIIPPKSVTVSDFDRQADTVRPVIVRDVEPNTPPAYTIPFGTVPMNHYIDAPRYRIMFDRIASHRFTGDFVNLLTYDMDIKQIFNDLMLKDILAEEDRKFMAVVETIIGPLNDVTNTNPRVLEVGAAGYVTAGPISRASLAHGCKGLPSTNRSLNDAVCLVNNVTIHDIVALDRIELGGDLAQEMFLNGFSERNVMGTQWYITIKKDLVANNSIYHFAAPNFIGDFCTFEDVTVSTKVENFLFEMFAYEMLGSTIKNSGAVARVDHTGSLSAWSA